MNCSCCGYPVALTPSGTLYPLTVAGPRNRTITHDICEDCARMFGKGKWRTTRLKLREMRGWK